MRRKHLVPLLILVVAALTALTMTFVRHKKPTLGLDLQGGASVVLQAKGNPTDGQMKLATDKIRNRIDSLGVAEPEVNRQGNTIVVSLPGVTDQERALKIVSQTGELRFRPVIQQLPADESVGTTDISALQAAFDATSTTTTAPVPAGPSLDPSTTAAGSTSSSALGFMKPRQTSSTTTTVATTSSASPTTTSASSSTATTAAGANTTAAGASTTTAAAGDTSSTTSPPVPTTLIKSTTIEEDDPTQTVVLPQRDKKTNKIVSRYQLGPAFLTGDGVAGAGTQFGTSNGWGVTLQLKDGDKGIGSWNKAAEDCFNGGATCPSRAIAIVLDGVVVSAPRIQPDQQAFSPFSKDQIQITGGGQSGFIEKEASDLATVLKDGALPIALEPQEVKTVSATLGKDSLKAGIVAGLVGIGLVLLFMLFYYRALALVVVAGLCVSGAILWSAISWRGAVLTLAGAAGIIVSIGVTVDSYVVFFERLKDNVQAGKSLKSSTTKGFADAWRTIVAADTVSLLAAAILYWRTVGSVRGFAFYLGLSTLIDLLVAYFFTRHAVALFAQSKLLGGKKVLGVTTGSSLATAGGAA
jgi:preprotein translocase subunit SecD